jgi:hypothetical protein
MLNQLAQIDQLVDENKVLKDEVTFLIQYPNDTTISSKIARWCDTIKDNDVRIAKLQNMIFN